MNELFKIIMYSSLAGLPIILGGLLSSIFQKAEKTLREEINHWIVAFGGGALLSAIAFALIPQSISDLDNLNITVIFLAGSFTFMAIDMILDRIRGAYSQVISMMSDFIPESLALGASFAHDHKFGLLLAVFIGMQNLPEGFNSYIELSRRLSKKKALWLMFFLSFLGIIAALSGKVFLSDNRKLIDIIMLYASGGILYLIFQDIAPLSRRQKDWIPATGASFGFLIGMIGEKLI